MEIWKILFKEIDLDDPTPLTDEVYWDARKREARVVDAVDGEGG